MAELGIFSPLPLYFLDRPSFVPRRNPFLIHLQKNLPSHFKEIDRTKSSIKFSYPKMNLEFRFDEESEYLTLKDLSSRFISEVVFTPSTNSRGHFSFNVDNLEFGNPALIYSLLESFGLHPASADSVNGEADKYVSWGASEGEKLKLESLVKELGASPPPGFEVDFCSPVSKVIFLSHSKLGLDLRIDPSTGKLIIRDRKAFLNVRSYVCVSPDLLYELPNGEEGFDSDEIFGNDLLFTSLMQVLGFRTEVEVFSAHEIAMEVSSWI